MPSFNFKVQFKKKVRRREKKTPSFSFKTVYVPVFGSQVCSSQRDGAQPDEYLIELSSTCCQGENCDQNVDKRVKSEQSDADGSVSGVIHSQTANSNKATNGKEKSKLAVLRTISRMLEENQHIRERLISLSQANRSFTD